MDNHIIDIKDTWKHYRGGVTALQGVSLQVPKGKIFGLLGPNGAGKSTLVKILTTIVKPNSCYGTMLGQKVGHKPTLKKIGYLPEHARFPEYLTGKEVLRYVEGLKGSDNQPNKNSIEQLLDHVGMEQWANKKMRSYSKGMKQRIGIAQALINDPELIFLDEPTDGVDPQGRAAMRAILEKLREDGKTVFINSHLLGELEIICNNVAIMNKGNIVKQGSIEELTAESQRYEISITESIPDNIKMKFNQTENKLNNSLILHNTNPAEIQPIIDLLRSNNLTIRSIKEIRQTLEELFMEAVVDSSIGGTNKN